MALTFANPGMVDQRSFPDLLNKAMDEIRLRADKVQPQLSPFFQSLRADGQTFMMSEVGSEVDLPQKSEDGSGVPRTQPAPGFDKTFTTVNYRRAIWATDDMIRRDRSGKIRRMLNGLPNSVLRLREYGYADVINNGFTSTTTADGQILWSAAHLWENPIGGTYSNLETAGAPTATRLATMRLNFRNSVDELGMPSPKRLARILAAPELEEDLTVLLKSNGKPGGALNDLNWNRAAAELVIGDWLSSTTVWIGFTEDEDTGLVEITEVPANYKPDVVNDPDIVWSQRVKTVFTVGAYHGKNSRGNAGA